MKSSVQSWAMRSACDDSDVTFERTDAAVPPASDLLEAMISELMPLYGRIDVPEAPSAGPEDFAPPGGSFLVGYENGAAICCGGIKRLLDGACEIKRMYVVGEARGRGVARALLVALEDAARDLGYGVVRLDTGAEQPHARALYESAGYRSIPNYNGNFKASFWREQGLGGGAVAR